MSVVENVKFGAVLKAAREEKNISIVQVSETLKLSIEKIENIESSDLAALPPAAFTCGYLRLFAKLVGLDEAEILHLYNQSIGVESAEAVPGATSDLPTQATSDDLGMRIVSYSLVLVVVVLFVFWLQNSSEAPVVVSTNPVQETVVAEKEAISEIDVSVDSVATEVQTTSKDVDQPVVETDKVIPVIADEEIKSLIEEKTDIDDEELQKTKNIELANEANPVALRGTDVIVLTAKDDCWVEVTDANDHLLYFSLLKKDEVAELKGQEPFSMFLGKATAVTLTLNDIQYDLSKHVRSNQIARFTMSMDKMLEKQVLKDVKENGADKPDVESSNPSDL